MASVPGWAERPDSSRAMVSRLISDTQARSLVSNGPNCLPQLRLSGDVPLQRCRMDSNGRQRCVEVMRHGAEKRGLECIALPQHLDVGVRLFLQPPPLRCRCLLLAASTSRVTAKLRAERGQRDPIARVIDVESMNGGVKREVVARRGLGVTPPRLPQTAPHREKTTAKR